MRKRMIFSICTLVLGILIYALSYYRLLIKNNSLTQFIRNFIPDMLWVMSFYTLCTIFTKKLTKNYIVFTAIYVIALCCLFELLQLKHIVNGIFDILDIMAYIFAAFVCCLLEKCYWRDKI